MKWRTRDGTTMDVKEMGDSHLQNSINMLKRKLEAERENAERTVLFAETDEYYDSQYLGRLAATIDGLKKEQKRRNKLLIHPTLYGPRNITSVDNSHHKTC